MNTDPCILVLPLDGKNTDTVIKGLLDVPSLPTAETLEGGVKSYSWLIENKYYTSSVKIAVLENAEDASSSLIDRVEALILLFDGAKSSPIEEITSSLSSLTFFHPEVKLLVCDKCEEQLSQSSNSRPGVLQWCIDNGWELVELSPEDQEEEDEEALQDDFADSYGVTRLRQALHAHTWSNLEMKGSSKSDAMSDMFKAISLSEVDNSQTACSNYELLQNSEDLVASVHDSDQEEDDVNDFEMLLSAFGDMKDKASNLPQNERKQYAEKVTLAFWRALGGDEEEIRGLDLPFEGDS